MLKVGIFGTGHLGKIHIKCIQSLDEYEIVGFFDPDPETAEFVQNQFKIPFFNSPDKLIKLSDVVDIVSPTYTHFEIAKKAIDAGKHVFIEKPLCKSVEEALSLEKVLNIQKLHLQVGHVERFNPAWTAAKPYFDKPLFIEGHRLATFNPRGTDVSVVEDLMIHDLDLILQLIKSPVSEIRANGVSILSKHADLCNARIQFENGAVANLTASRMSLKQMRKLRIFQKDAYISLDFLERNAEVIRILEHEPTEPEPSNIFELPVHGETKKIQIIQVEKKEVNAIQQELLSFHNSILKNIPPEVSIKSGIAALELAEQIKNCIKLN